MFSAAVLVIPVGLVMLLPPWLFLLSFSDAFCSVRRCFGRGLSFVCSSSLSELDATEAFVFVVFAIAGADAVFGITVLESELVVLLWLDTIVSVPVLITTTSSRHE